MQLPFEIIARTHLAKAEEYWLADRLGEAHAAMALALNTGVAPSDVYDRQRTIEAELAARMRGERRRIAEHLVLETAAALPARILGPVARATWDSWLDVTVALRVRWGKPVLVTIFGGAEDSLFIHSRYGYYRERSEVHKVCLPSSLIGSLPILRQAVLHEVAHAAIHDVAGEAVPRWLDEGVAVWMEGGGGPLETRQLRIAAAKGRTPTMREVSARLESYDTDLDSIAAGVSYAAAGVFVEHIVGAHSAEAVVRVLRALREGGDMERAFRAAIGRSLRDVEAEWRRGAVGGPTRP